MSQLVTREFHLPVNLNAPSRYHAVSAADQSAWRTKARDATAKTTAFISLLSQSFTYHDAQLILFMLHWTQTSRRGKTRRIGRRSVTLLSLPGPGTRGCGSRVFMQVSRFLGLCSSHSWYAHRHSFLISSHVLTFTSHLKRVATHYSSGTLPGFLFVFVLIFSNHIIIFFLSRIASFVSSFLVRLLFALLDAGPLVSQGFLSIGRRGVQSLGVAVNPPVLDPPADSREPRPVSRAE